MLYRLGCKNGEHGYWDFASVLRVSVLLTLSGASVGSCGFALNSSYMQQAVWIGLESCTFQMRNIQSSFKQVFVLSNASFFTNIVV